MLLLPFLLSGWRVAAAGEFRITPIIHSVPPGDTMASYRLRNTGKAPITIQVSAFDWRQEQGHRALDETEQLLVVPPLVTLDTGEEQLVRVALQTRERQRELPFRLHFQEIPEQPEEDTLTVGTALRIDVPLFFSVADAAPQVQWTLARTRQGGLALAGHNTGNAYARFSSLKLETADGETQAHVQAPIYLLPGKYRVWHFPKANAGAGSEVILSLREGADGKSQPLVVE